jgi:hypothetical protein
LPIALLLPFADCERASELSRDAVIAAAAFTAAQASLTVGRNLMDGFGDMLGC